MRTGSGVFLKTFVMMEVLLALLSSLAVAQLSDDSYKGVEIWNSFLQAQKVAILSSQVDGEIVRLNREPQDYVEKGTVLIQLDDELVRLRIESIDTQIKLATGPDEARIRFEYSQDNWEITRKLYEEVIGDSRVASDREWKLAQQEKDLAELGVKKAEREFKLLQLELRQNDLLLRKHAISAPMSGVIVPFSSVKKFEDLKQVEVGEVVRAGQTLLALMKVDRLRAFEPLPASQLQAVQLGQDALVYVQGVGEEGIPAKVVYKSPTVESTGQFHVEVEFENPLMPDADKLPTNVYPYQFRPGMQARVQLLDQIDSSTNASEVNP